MRQFTSGATRDDETGKNDYEGFLSPLVIRRFGDYMTLHRKQADGGMRDSDNWQKGMEQSVYLKSMFRHFMDLWSIWRGHTVLDSKDAHKVTRDEACCAIMFNIMGFLHEELKATAPAFVGPEWQREEAEEIMASRNCNQCSTKCPMNGLEQMITCSKWEAPLTEQLHKDYSSARDELAGSCGFPS